MSRLLCAVFRSRRNPDTYLFVDHQDGFARVPEALLREFGGAEMLLMTPEGVMTMNDVLPQAFGPENLEKAGE